MRLKTYFATGVDAAMTLARQELGPDAMLVHSKRTLGEAQALGSYEVVFAINEDAARSQSVPESRVETPVTSPAVPPPVNLSPGTAELAGLQSMMEQTLRLVRRSETMLRSKERLEGDLADLDGALEDAGFSGDFRSRVQQELPASSASVRQRALLWLDRQIRLASQVGKTGFARKTVALVGPCGAGKTTTLIKLAAQFGVGGRRPAQILSMDADRVGASEALRVNAGVLGIGFQLLDTTHALSQALAEHAHKDLILIDTPGYPAASMPEAAPLATFLSSRKEIDTHLVLPADLPVSGLQSLIARYAVFEPGKLLFTRIDEIQAVGPMLEAAISSRLPLSYQSSGQRIPEDLMAADKTALLQGVLPGWLEGDPDVLRTRKAAA
jgi:flagellar biosynthesis GTPase FlhF